MMRTSTIALAAALLLGAIDARGANPPGALDQPPSNVVPVPVEIVPNTVERPQPPSEPGGNPLWAIPLSSLTATRERPLFLPTRRAPAAAVAGPVAVAAPPAPPPAEPESPQLMLVGAIVSDTEGIAVFLDPATNNIIRLKTGQDHDGWVLRSVKGREATLEKNQRTATMALPVPGEAAAPPGPPPVPGRLPRPPGPPGKRAEPEL
jgi:general secretion pathway protein N